MDEIAITERVSRRRDRHSPRGWRYQYNHSPNFSTGLPEGLTPADLRAIADDMEALDASQEDHG